MTETHHVVVDGSNLATEGRTVPSLAQLDEAVRAYLAEDPGAEIVVVVDASFSHRIDPAERSQLEAAELHGEVVAPPAGAIGRGDAFVLRIAERTGAVVLSNDSFQEFHEEHAWLFDEGRLIGGKPVPGVGWIFTPRRPVPGPRSRKATRAAENEGEADDQLSAPRKAAEVAKALKRAAKASGGRTKAVAKVPEAEVAKKKAGQTATSAKASPEKDKPEKEKKAAKAQGVRGQGASLKADGASVAEAPTRSARAKKGGGAKGDAKDKPKVAKADRAAKTSGDGNGDKTLKRTAKPAKAATRSTKKSPTVSRAARPL